MYRIFIIALSLTAFCTPAHSQSFNCKYGKKADEKLICSDPELGQLDERMVAIFEELMEQAPPYLKRMLRAEQDGWLVSRHACRWNTRCVRGHYLARTRQLNAMFESSGNKKREDYDQPQDGSRRYQRNPNDGYFLKRDR